MVADDDDALLDITELKNDQKILKQNKDLNNYYPIINNKNCKNKKPLAYISYIKLIPKQMQAGE